MTEISMNQSIQYILHRQFRKAKTILATTTSEKFAMDDFVRENSRVVCEVIQDMQSLGKVKFKHIGELRNLVNKVIGLPINVHTVHNELVINYNYAVCLLLAQCQQINAAELLEQHIDRSFLRVMTLCGKQKKDDDICTSWQDDISSIVQWLASNNPFCLEICFGLFAISSLHWMLNSRIEDSVKLLSNIERSMNDLGCHGNQSKIQDPIGVMVPLNGSQPILLATENESDQDTYHLGLLKLIKLWIYYIQEDTSKCLRLSASFSRNEKNMSPWFAAQYMYAYLQYQEGQYNEAAAILQTIVELLSSVDVSVQYSSIVRTLLGCCLAHQDKNQTAIHQFSKALQDNFNNLSAMYNIAIQYRVLKWYDGELETWNLLLITLETNKTQNDDRNQKLVVKLQDNLMCGYHRTVKVCRSAAQLKRPTQLYVMARRCLDLKWYEIASQRYLDLMALIMENTFIQIYPEFTSEICLPDIATIYSEMTSALLLSQNFDDVEIVCEQIIPKLTYRENNKLNLIHSGDLSDSEIHSQLNSSENTFQDNDGLTQESDAGQIPSQLSRKRFRSEEDMSENTERGRNDIRLANIVSILMMQAEALMKMEEFDDAVGCLDDVCHLLSDVIPGCVDEVTQKVDSKDHKRRRLNTDGDVITDSDTNPYDKHLLNIKSMAYNNKAMIHIGQGKLQEAVTSLLLSVQCNQDNQEAIYNHTLLLLRLGRLQDAVMNWSQFRRIDTKMDVIQMSHLLKTKQTMLRSSKEKTLSDLEYQSLRLDQVIIEQWQKLKLKH
ncbi:uncharacterized protein [Ptychodera flava]|uniref:uncharacterized protein isoform X1 n=1 Tax=Ptychodera flava TaxID=63121 RepID=UPI00396A9B96